MTFILTASSSTHLESKVLNIAILLPRLELSKISPFFAGDSDVSLTGVLLCYFAASKVLWDALLIITRNFLECVGLVFICTSKYKFLFLDCL